MIKKIFNLIFIIMLLVISSCREAYLPPAIKSANNFLVVEGIINAGMDSTIFKLTRTKNLGDTTLEIPELFARVQIEAQSGAFYVLTGTGNGIYSSGPMPLNSAEMYRLTISTVSGGFYQSDLVQVKQTPAIDSLNWKLNKDVTIYVSSHDATNNTRYYRWDFMETWEYETFYDSNLGYDYGNDRIYFRDISQLLTRCWSSARSAGIFIGTSDNLTNDIISQIPLTTIPDGSDKIRTRYSILVKQYALTRPAFEYWQLLRKNSKELGSIFGNQPAEFTGNIRCLSNPEEPVIGFVSASTVTQKRIFIKNSELNTWNSPNLTSTCSPIIIPQDSTFYYLVNNPDYAPAYFLSGTPNPLAIAKRKCVDCTLSGGNTSKPSYW